MDSVLPLRIAKVTTPSAPTGTKTTTMAKSPRPLSEIGVTSQRRNSPSYNQATKRMMVSQDTSPYTENVSPTRTAKPTLRDFWSSKEVAIPSRFEDNTPERSPSPSLQPLRRRPSVERLMQASRVKNSKMFALESKDAYDPAITPTVERPSANRPLSEQISNNSFARLDSLKRESRAVQGSYNPVDGDLRLKSPSKIPLPPSPEKQGSPSPTKSSLARISQFGMPKSESFTSQQSESNERVQKPRTLRRHAKSVTFHEDPPEVNEYEQPTPEPSLSAASDREGSWDSDDFYDPDYSFERGSSLEPPVDDSFDADLENADKTPVVLPEDWSRMSPEEARTDLVNGNDDVFDTSDEPTQRLNLGRSDSRVSSDESRPLPPLPGLRSPKISHPVDASRDPPSPLKRASCSKDDILRITSSSPLSAHERLSLLMAAKKPTSTTDELGNASETLMITNLDTGERTDVEVPLKEDVSMADDLPDLTSPPRISRESILRKVRNTKYDFDDEDDLSGDYEDEGFDASPGRPTLAELARMDPDEAVPSRENSREKSDAAFVHHSQADFGYLDDVKIKSEPLDDLSFDMSAIPDIHDRTTRSPSRLDDYDRQSSVLRHHVEYDDVEEESEYMNSILPDGESTPTAMRSPVPEEGSGKETLNDAMQLLTVHDYTEAASMAPKQNTVEVAKTISDSFSSGLPTYLSTDDFGSGFEKFITPSPPSTADSASNPASNTSSFKTEFPIREAAMTAIAAPKISPPTSPFLMGRDEARGEYSEISCLQDDEFCPPCVQEIPERKATIRTNGRLKARPSGSAADFQSMAEQRRLDEMEYPVPAIPQAFSAEVECAETERSCYSSSSSESKADSLVDDSHMKRESTTMLDLDIPTNSEEGLDLGAAFDKVIENQKKGYVMRENEKVVFASNRNVSGESHDTAHSSDSAATISEDKPLPARPNSNSARRRQSGEQFLKTEPWNGATRRKSIRNASSNKPMPHVQHPAVGQKPLGVVDEDYAAGSSNLDDEIADDVERGRLFVKVVGVRDLELPLPKNDRVYFQLTLDNGLHCVTTSDLELNKNASVGQEFELVVLNDLEFQLTLTTRLPPPPAANRTTSIPSPVKSNRTPKAGFSRFLSSPKKRAEKERLEREAAEAEERRRQEEARRKRAALKPTAWDLLHELVNEADGSFARAYVNLKAHEKQCFGRQLTVRVPCYNEWALEKDASVMTSVRSKRGNKTGPIRRPPYIVGYVELQLLYIPKPKGATDEDMPKSMNSAIREMNKASEAKSVTHDGYLSQQGGDCTHWRRRFFRLQGVRLTAYHEHTNQKRAVINLSKASRLVDDRSMLVADPTSANPKSKNRRKSAFAEEDEGYQYVEEGFRLRFANGETIDFYADSRARKDEWMQVLSQVIGKPDSGKKGTMWTDLVLAREQAEGPADVNKAIEPVRASVDESVTGEHVELPGSEVRDVINKSVAAAAATAVPRKQAERKPVATPTSVRSEPKDLSRPPNTRARTPPLNARTGVRSRTAVKSMIF